MRKKIVIALLGLHTLQVEPITIPMLGQVKQLISYIARSPKLLLNSMGKHKIVSTIAVAATALLAIPKTRHILLQSAQFIGKHLTALSMACDKLTRKMLPSWLVWQEPAIFRDIRLRQEWQAYHDQLRFNIEHGFGIDVRMAEIARDIQGNHHIIVDNNLTPLHVAAIYGQATTIHELVASHAHIEARDIDGRTPLHYAAYLGHRAAVQALIHAGADINALGINNMTPLHPAAAQGHREIVQELIDAHANLEAQDDSHKTPLHRAAQTRHLEVVQALINAGANINALDINNYTPISIAIQHGRREVVQALINTHANINAPAGQISPLHVAALVGSFGPDGNLMEEIIPTLIEAHADIDAQDEDQNTPLHYAALMGHIESVRQLIQAGANTTILNNDGNTARVLTHNQEIIDHFNNIPRLINDFQAAAQHHDFAAIRTLVTQGAPFVDEHGNSPLHQNIGAYNQAIPTAQDNIAKELIRAIGPRAHAIRDGNGKTPLHITAQNSNLWMAEYLLRHGADINARDNDGNTPLHYAASYEMRDKLLRHHADVSLANQAGETALSHNVNLWGSIFRSTEQVPQ